jgi:hypothetical protein
VTGAPIAVGSTECASKAGGVKYTLGATSTNVCTGKAGENGSPWTAGGVLPPEQTETGTYLLTSETGTGSFSGYAVTNISFPIPLAEGVASNHTIYIKNPVAEIPDECENEVHPGVASVKNPEAEPGYLCLFNAAALFNMGEEFLFFRYGGLEEGAGTTGALLAQPPTGAEARSEGTWAVTAPEE